MKRYEFYHHVVTKDGTVEIAGRRLFHHHNSNVGFIRFEPGGIKSIGNTYILLDLSIYVRLNNLPVRYEYL